MMAIGGQETKKEYKIPLLPKAIEILKHYRGHSISVRRKKLLPIHSNQKMNAYLKEIQNLCKIDKKLHFHLARKSFSVSIILVTASLLKPLVDC